MKDSFVFHKEWRDALVGMPNDVRLEVYEAIIEYGISGTEPDNLKPLARCAFNFVKTTLDRDRERYEEIKQKRIEAGSKGGLAKATKCQQKVANGSKSKQSLANVADNVYVDVNVNKLSNESVINAPAPTREGYDVNEIYLNEFFETKQELIEKLLMDFGMKPDEKKKLRDMAESIINEWNLIEKFHPNKEEWRSHLINTLRKKVQLGTSSAPTKHAELNDLARQVREEREQKTQELIRKHDEWASKSVSLEEARNSEEYKRAMAEA